MTKKPTITARTPGTAAAATATATAAATKTTTVTHAAQQHATPPKPLRKPQKNQEKERNGRGLAVKPECSIIQPRMLTPFCVSKTICPDFRK